MNDSEGLFALKITKLEHACLILEDDSGQKLIIDPGAYPRPLENMTGVVGIVITHKHDDHCDEQQLFRLLQANPGCAIFGTAEVAERLSDFKVTIARHGDFHPVSGFELEFFGDLHQVIHSSIPLIQNLGVLVNRTLYYPGDSYTRCDYPFEVLACPSSAPWLRISDVIDFLQLTKPGKCFPTHNALLSDIGNSLQNSRIREITEAGGGEFRYLEPGEVWEL